jgi:hypothetical protein
MKKTETSRSEDTWPLFGSYRIVNDFLLPEGPETGRYDLLLPHRDRRRGEALVTEFSRLLVADDLALLTFARSWGPLGYLEGSAEPPGLSRGRMPDGDPASWIWNHSLQVYFILTLLYYRQIEYLDGLAQFLKAQSFGLMARPALSGIALVTAEGTEVPVDFDHVDESASLFIETAINETLDRTVRLRLQGSPLDLRPHPRSLLGAIYHHLAKLITDRTELRLCAECNRLFPVTDRRQTVCPPESWSSSNESRCAARSRKRRQRHGQAS